LAGREGFTAAKTAQTAQYAPKIPRITLRIAVLLIKKPTKSPFNLPWPLLAAAGEARACKQPLYPHLTPVVVSN
jgi:hypothetical protein